MRELSDVNSAQRELAVSVVLVTFNSASDINACIEALEMIPGDISVEVIVVDNASQDGTVRRFAAAKRRKETVVIENRCNRGFAAAANQGARRSRGEFVLFLNPDARLEERSLTALLSVLRLEPGVGAAGPQLVGPDGSLQISARPRPGLVAVLLEALLLDSLFPRSRWLCTWATDEDPLPAECLSGACLLIRRSLFESLGGFDERFFLYAEDVDLCARARLAGYRLMMVPRARVTHRIGGSAFQQRADFVLQINRAKLQWFRKHLEPWRGALCAGLQLSGLGVHAGVHGLQGLLRRRPDRLREARHEVRALATLLKERPFAALGSAPSGHALGV
jgi:hypothetical protein